MSNPIMEPRVTSLEPGMADLKEIVAETSRQIETALGAIAERQERADSEYARFESRLEKLQEKSDREFVELRKEMKAGQDRLSNEMKEILQRIDSNFERLLHTLKDVRIPTDSSVATVSLGTQLWLEEQDRRHEEWREEGRQHNLNMAKIYDKHGSLCEDMVAPNICSIMKTALGIDSKEFCFENVWVKAAYRGDRTRIEVFELIAECLDYVLVNVTRSKPKQTDVDELIDTIGMVLDYFPRYSDRKFVGAVASIHIDPEVVNYATERGIIALAVGYEQMEIQNPAGFKPAVW